MRKRVVASDILRYVVSFCNASLPKMFNYVFLCMSTYIDTSIYDMFIWCWMGLAEVYEHIDLLMVQSVLHKFGLETRGSLDDVTM